MRKIIVSNMVSLDGFFSGPNGEIDWHVVNDEFFAHAINLLNSVDTLLFGRITYQGMLDYWTSPAAITDDAVIAEKMNHTPKVIFSKTLTKVEWGKWNNAALIKDNIAEAVTKLKQQPGKDMVIFGSGKLVSSLTELGLIDEYQIFVVPGILGKGKPLFEGLTQSVKLKLKQAKNFNTGVVALFYELAAK